MAVWISSIVSSWPARYFSISASSDSTAASITSCRACSTRSLKASATGISVKVLPRVSSSKMNSTRRSTSMCPVKVSPGADRQLDRERPLGQPAPDHRQAAVEVGADPVHLVREDDPRHAVPVGLAPHRLGLGLDARHRVQQGHRAVEHPQRPLDFDREVHVAGRVDDVDPVHHVVPGPETGRGGGGDGDAPLLLLLHPVHRGRALVHFTDLVVLAGVVEDPLGRSRLPGINVGHDADVPVQFERRCTRHTIPVSSLYSAKKRGDRAGQVPVVSLRARPGFPPRRGVSWTPSQFRRKTRGGWRSWPPSRGPIIGRAPGSPVSS